MRHRYACADCGTPFWIELTDLESASKLDPHDEACPACGRRVGRGQVTCRGCGAPFETDLPHSHVQCNVAMADCPRCGTPFLSPCIC